MPREPLSIRLWHFLRSVGVIEMLIVAIVGAVGLLLGWRSPREYGEGLIYAGIGAFILGAASVISSLGMSRSADYQYAKSVGANSIDQNVRQAMKESKESYGFLCLMATVGLIAAVAGGIVTGFG